MIALALMADKAQHKCTGVSWRILFSDQSTSPTPRSVRKTDGKFWDGTRTDGLETDGRHSVGFTGARLLMLPTERSLRHGLANQDPCDKMRHRDLPPRSRNHEIVVAAAKSSFFVFNSIY